jgi:hypothetical protein
VKIPYFKAFSGYDLGLKIEILRGNPTDDVDKNNQVKWKRNFGNDYYTMT